MWVNRAMVRHAFGWNYAAWSKAFLDAVGSLPSEPRNILEIGAGDLSIVSLMFDKEGTKITVGYHADMYREPISKKIESLRIAENLKAQYVVSKIDAFTVIGDYDLVIMKSVLGGLFRNHSSNLQEINHFINQLRKRTLASDGVLISIDNGESIFEKYMSRLGARRNNWRYFKTGQLQSAKVQSHFGVLSAFSAETRWGRLGCFIDNQIMYPIDRVLTSMIKSNPTVIASVF